MEEADKHNSTQPKACTFPTIRSANWVYADYTWGNKI